MLPLVFAFAGTVPMIAPRVSPTYRVPLRASLVQPDAKKVIPPPGIMLSDTDRAELSAQLAVLTQKANALTKNPLWPDVEIFRKAVDWSLSGNTIYNAGEVAAAKRLLAEGIARADALASGKAPWTTQTGLVVRGYISTLDDSVQPYGLVVPPDYRPGDGKKRRLDLFLHGRGEQLTELSFLDQRMRSPGEFTPEGALVLHPYGRFCNANHLAGEVDVFEGIDSVKSRYPIDPDKIVVRGFSMGGASAWHLAVHYADFWAAAAPGAGFTETAQFQRIFGPGKTPPPAYEQTLWHIYDSADYAVNISGVPTVAYSGEIDGQKQAADVMASMMLAEGLTLTHIIGPQTPHRYHPQSKIEINAFIDAAIVKGKEKAPLSVRFTTWTLRYPGQYWVTIDGMDKHWERARVDATRDASDANVTVKTVNVSALKLSTPGSPKNVTIDGQSVGGGRSFVKGEGGKWKAGTLSGLRKKPALQGPIDDAFMTRFVFVRPTGAPMNAELGAWTDRTRVRAEKDWRTFFRGDVRAVDDTKLSADDLRNSNLVLWGDPSSNAVLRRLLPKLPIRWDANGLVVNGRGYAANVAAPVLIFPNPLNPERYIVVNAGYSSWEYNPGSNALHTPKLPDWAVLSLSAPTQSAGVLDAGFFDEMWKLP